MTALERIAKESGLQWGRVRVNAEGASRKSLGMPVSARFNGAAFV